MNHAQAMARPTELTQLERILLLVPLAGGTVFGLLPFLLGGAAGALLGGGPGNDSFIYRLAGAANLGYALGLGLGIRDGRWNAIRLPIIGTLVFNLGSVIACFNAMTTTGAPPIVYLILLASILIIAITSWVIVNRGNARAGSPDMDQLEVIVTVIGTAASGFFAIVGLFLPVVGSQFLGFKGTDVFLIQQAGAATLGYVAIAALGLRSRSWLEFRLPNVMALVFNGLAFVASIIALFTNEPLLITVVIGAASGVMTLAALSGLRKHGI